MGVASFSFEVSCFFVGDFVLKLSSAVVFFSAVVDGTSVTISCQLPRQAEKPRATRSAAQDKTDRFIGMVVWLMRGDCRRAARTASRKRKRRPENPSRRLHVPAIDKYPTAPTLMTTRLRDRCCADNFPDLAAGSRRSDVRIVEDVDFVSCALTEALQESSERLVVRADLELKDGAPACQVGEKQPAVVIPKRSPNTYLPFNTGAASLPR